jgi:DNA-binding CsgD family transcriptional regulator/tetratricopeptide (TPR) repeat protein
MVLDMAAPAKADPFLGRQYHLGILRGVAHGVSTGHPSLVVMRGEAGIGKTRLVTEFCADLVAAGWTVRIGSCTPLVGPTLAYGPWTAACLPEAGPSCWAPEVGAEPVALERLGERVLADLTRAQQEAPVALILEDMHWADRSSLALLAFVVRGLRAARRVLIWVTARDEVAPGDDDGFELVLAELLRREPAVALSVGRLDEAEVQALTEAIAGPAAADANWVRSVVHRGAGNPYVVRQLAAAGPTDQLPAALHAVLTGRLSQAGPAVRAVVEAVALAGVPVRPRVLEAALNVMPGSVDDAVVAGLRAGLLTVSADNRYEITHALLAETAVANLLPGRRERLHARLADAFAAAGSDGDHGAWLSLIAEHRSAAGELEPAIAALVTAGRAVAAAGAHPEAYQLLSRAHGLAQRAPDVPREPAIAQLRRECAAEAFWAGQPSEAVELLQLVLKESTLPTDEEAALRLDLARALRAAGRGRDSLAAVAEAYEAVQDEPASLPVASTYAAQAAATMMTGRYRQVAPIADATLAMLDLLDSRGGGPDDGSDGARPAAATTGAVRSNVLNTLGVSVALLGDLDRGRALLLTSITLADAADSVEDICRGYNNLAFVLENAGLFEDSATASMRCITEARARGVELSAAGLAVCNALESLYCLGRWAEAEELIGSTIDRPFPDEVLAAVRHSAAQLALGRGHLDQAHGHLTAAEQAAAGVEAPQPHAQLRQLRAEIALADHDPQVALDTVEQALAAVASSDDDSHLLPLVIVGLQALNDLLRRPASLEGITPTAAVRRAAALWRRTGQPVKPSAPPAVGPADEPASVPAGHPAGDPAGDPAAGLVGRRQLAPQDAAEVELGQLEYARLRGRDTAAGWAANADAWAGLRRRWLAGYAKVRQAEVMLRTDRADRGGKKAAAVPLDEAEQLLAALGEPVALVAEIQQLRRLGRLEAPPSDPPAEPTTRLDAVAARVGLTNREREVLALLADGLTNRRIASTLFMTEKTASVHVSHIMSKLNASTRGEAVAAARRVGLLPPVTS